MAKYENYALAIDIGGTSVKYAYISEKGEICNKSSFNTECTRTRDAFLRKLYIIIGNGVACGIKYVGISSLGIFDKSGRCLGGVENLCFLESMNLPQQVKLKYPEIACCIVNDGTAAAMGEYWLGEGRDCDSFICMTLGTGIGGAVVIDGRPIRGSHFQSSEIGYSNYRSEADYLEVHYSTKGILERAAELLDIETIEGPSFVKKVKNEEPLCKALFGEWMDVLAQILANSILLIDPEKVIVGGGISEEKEWLCDAIYEHLEQRLPAGFRGKVQVRAAQHGNDAGLLGAVESYFKIRSCSE